MEVNAIQKSSIHDMLFNELKESIVSGKLNIGMKLPKESELCQRFKVSRTILRETIKSLQALGLVSVVQGKGTVVTQPTIELAQDILGMHLDRILDSFDALIEARMVIEPEIAAMAAQRRTEEELEEMKKKIEQFKFSKTLKASIRADMGFHECLVRAAKNKVFSIIMMPLVSVLQKSQRVTLKKSKERGMEGHISILKAVESRNPILAREAMLAHLKKAKEDFRVSLSNSKK